jgi:hypothetical protein
LERNHDLNLLSVSHWGCQVFNGSKIGAPAPSRLTGFTRFHSGSSAVDEAERFLVLAIVAGVAGVDGCVAVGGCMAAGGCAVAGGCTTASVSGGELFQNEYKVFAAEVFAAGVLATGAAEVFASGCAG